MPLPIWRRVGAGFYVGRNVRVTVTDVADDMARVSIEAPIGIAVSGPSVKAEDHLAMQKDREANLVAATEIDVITLTLLRSQAAQIGRGVRLEFTGCTKPLQATLEVSAPRNVAVTRDEYSREEHLTRQTLREQGTVSEV